MGETAMSLWMPPDCAGFVGLLGLDQVKMAQVGNGLVVGHVTARVFGQQVTHSLEVLGDFERDTADRLVGSLKTLFHGWIP
jgi:hypothetical protein